ncbi:MAG: ABC transporter ATP-binding protein, partial [Desulfobacteraceae bacterium]
MMSGLLENSRQALVCLENAKKTYTMGSQAVSALGGINISFDQGSFWAVMGASGSGKSTLMNIIGCLDRLSGGHYLFQGKDISGYTDNALSDLRLRHLGFVFQSFNLLPQLTVQRNIELPLYYLGWNSIKSADHAKKMAALVGLENRLNHRPSELSGGQMQRVAIARALAADPDLILADEPTGNLPDPAAAVEQARKLGVDPDVVGAIGHFREDTTAAAATTYAEAGIPLIAPAVLNADL